MPEPQTIVLLTLALSLVLLVTDALRYEAVAILVVVILAATGCLETEQAFAGFADPAVVLVAAMYVFAAAVSRTGVTEVLSQKLLGGKPGSEGWLAFRVVLVSGLLSSILSNAAVVATLIPILGTVAKRSQIPVSRLFIPLSYGSLMGGMLTVIGTSKNIAVNGIIKNQGAEPFGLFDFTAYGFCLLILGSLYFLGPGRRLLPRTRVDQSLSEHYQVPKFVTEVLVEPSSSLINRTVAEIEIFERYGISLLGLVRGGKQLLAPGPYDRFGTDDVLMLQGEPEDILRMRSELGLKQRESVSAGELRLTADDVQMVEGVVPANSPLIRRTLIESDFRANTGLNVLAISKAGDVIPVEIAKTPLDVGDTLLLQGHAPDIQRIHQNRQLIILAEHSTAGFGKNAILTLGLLAAVLGIGGFTSVHISVAALMGAMMLVLLKCVLPGDVRRTVNWSVLILIGGMLALGKAFEQHGLDDKVADLMISASGGLPSTTLILGVLLGTTLLLTQIINHVAAATIMTPVALALAAHLGLDDRAFLMAVLTGAEFAFMSPVAHQANAMVMGPGDYKYKDFLRAGTPLTIGLSIAAVFLIRFFWPG